jgi:hypothetical protein
MPRDPDKQGRDDCRAEDDPERSSGHIAAGRLLRELAGDEFEIASINAKSVLAPSICQRERVLVWHAHVMPERGCANIDDARIRASSAPRFEVAGDDEAQQPNPRARISVFGRVGVWRSGGRPSISVAAPFVWRCLTRSAVVPVSTPRSSNRTCRSPASGSRTRLHAFTHDGPRPSVSGVRAGSTRKGARVDSSRPCVA